MEKHKKAGYLRSYREIAGSSEPGIALFTRGSDFEHSGATGSTGSWPIGTRPFTRVYVFLEQSDHPNEIWVGTLAGKKLALSQTRSDGRLIRKYRLTLKNLKLVCRTVSSFSSFFEATKGSRARVLHLPRPRQPITRASLFARVGFMNFYNPDVDSEERPQGGGTYNDHSTGHEIFNFKPVNGQLYGYFQPRLRPGTPSTINLRRVDGSGAPDALENVLVLFFSPAPLERGQILVGWYKHATVFREFQEPAQAIAAERNSLRFNLTAAVENGMLLPPDRRPQLFPAGESGENRPGQANVFYVRDAQGELKDFSGPKGRWIHAIFQWVEDYAGPNLLVDPYDAGVDAAVRNALGASGGQGIRLDSKDRKLIENCAMDAAQKLYKKNFKVKDVSKTKPYDFLCTSKKDAAVVVRLEVKGTTTGGQTVFLTPNEVQSAQKNLSHLFVLHSITLQGEGKNRRAVGGKSILFEPWQLETEHLKPYMYVYSVKDARR